MDIQTAEIPLARAEEGRAGLRGPDTDAARARLGLSDSATVAPVD